MDETHEIKSLGDGKYSFWIGRQRYTLTTKLEAARFFRIVESARELVEAFPPNLSQDERLFLALMALSHQVEELSLRIGEISDKFSEQDSDPV
ncbi:MULTISPECIES: hypothetical protein [Cloacibacillus]|uniref:Cell division protein ZapA n=1 Tax=Cloacibacillus porcorum TaxID=1197717 RepID=A0A1B2I5Z2_9BACT|nr:MULTISPECIES: hypothetical protein [Cloacibacillus]MCD7951640.1 hypothetical protein [Synergistaceae bacterium]ANZ45376.1 hypothetical protein BED41_10075 [Cloacibacillus porcorum]MCC8058420.1 hypothetical protein [Cloacibacillus sp.]MDD7648300.1 hypothetical protein [Cloacibacillus porcorum]MDY4092301.1 hypothetical protein [Cloacibacillus porcorum]